jgi:hypothetical protein
MKKLLNKRLKRVEGTYKGRNGTTTTSPKQSCLPEDILLLKAVLKDLQDSLEGAKDDAERAQEVVARLQTLS